tara:strand:- start:84 stop:686 length:603 start_codon:yes stop_codon:yes gene_type:complete
MKTLNGWLTHMKDDESWIRSMFVESGKYMSVIKYIIKNKPKFIVEYGGGQSTWMLTELINYLDYGGKIVGYEGEEFWYNAHVKAGWNEHNNVKLVDAVEDVFENDGYRVVNGIRYVHPMEDIEGVDFVILDGPDLREELWKNNPSTTFNLMDIVNHIGYEIPFFIDGRLGTRDFYTLNPNIPSYNFTCDYKLNIGDEKIC